MKEKVKRNLGEINTKERKIYEEMNKGIKEKDKGIVKGRRKNH